MRLDKATRDGDAEVAISTNLPVKTASAALREAPRGPKKPTRPEPSTLGTCHETTEAHFADDGSATVTVPTKQLVVLGDYQIYNNDSADHYVVPEATKGRYFTVTGPVPVP